MRKLLISFTIVCLFCIFAFAQAKTQQLISPTGFVNDFAGVLDFRTKIDLEDRLRRYFENEGLEITLVTVKTTGNITASDFSLSLAQNKKPSRAAKPYYRMLLLVAVNDGKYWTQVSRDAEEVFSNEWLDKAQKQNLVPDFQKGDYGTGLTKAVAEFMNKFSEFKGNKMQELGRKFAKYSPDQLLVDSMQAVVVRTAAWDAFQGTAQLFERTPPAGKWITNGSPFAVVIGTNGLAWSEDVAYLLEKKPENLKREGDRKSPAGIFELTLAFGSAEKPAFLKLPYTRLEEGTECVDDLNSASYNRIVDRFKIGNFDWNTSEKMLAVGPEYDLGVFVAHNSDPVKSGNGSCIFLHIWKDENSGTTGCTAMRRENIESILGWLDPSKKPTLIQFPAAEYDRLRDTWQLPQVK